jgi:hypothetical protein
MAMITSDRRRLRVFVLFCLLLYILELCRRVLGLILAAVYELLSDSKLAADKPETKRGKRFSGVELWKPEVSRFGMLRGEGDKLYKTRPFHPNYYMYSLTILPLSCNISDSSNFVMKQGGWQKNHLAPY